jgi:dipeptidyl aminopeptidase/acylaminoacyl peptidase
MKLPILTGLLALAVCFQCVAATVDVTPFTKRDGFEGIKLSPNGDYYAATVPQEGKSVLLIVHRGDNKPTGGFGLGKNNYVADFWWVSPKRLLISMERRMGALDQPQLTGNLYAINADGSGSANLVGQDVEEMGTGSHIQGRKQEMVAAFMVDDLPQDDRYVLIAVTPFNSNLGMRTLDGMTSRVEKMDVETGKRVAVVSSPVRNADFITDHQGIVRFASGTDSNDVHHLYYRANAAAQWQQINNEQADGHAEFPIGFSADDRLAYLQVQQVQGPNAIVAMDTTNATRKSVFRDGESNPGMAIFDTGVPGFDGYGLTAGSSGTPVGTMLMGDKPRTQFFDPNGSEARLYHSLEAAFPGNSVGITSKTADGKLALVEVSSDRNPGDFYFFDTVNKKADHLLSRRDWFDPEAMAPVRPFNFKARDGMTLFGYLTMPRNAGKNLPMVVLPHGGPFFVADHWQFDTESQMLAAAGYAVLQVNYRGSSGHGLAYERAGMRQWGGKMQDDVTDATHWAIDQGIADAQRICIYGASYGGYAALMGVAKEPTLYKCAAGYVGVYDLPMMFGSGDISGMSYGKAYMHDWIGEPSELGKVSPAKLASQIKVPVLLAAGGQDERAPIAQSEEMEKALRAAGVPVETLYFRTEGHGFYEQAHQQEFYNKLLAFLDRNIGAAGGSAPAATAQH